MRSSPLHRHPPRTFVAGFGIGGGHGVGQAVA